LVELLHRVAYANGTLPPDIKPANIYVKRDDTAGIVFLGDLGFLPPEPSSTDHGHSSMTCP
jgi:hypothetical protein